MKPSSAPLSLPYSSYTKDKCLPSDRPVAFLLASLIVATIFSLVFLYSSSPSNLLDKHDHDSYKPQIIEIEQSCDLFKGYWVRDFSGSSTRYTGTSCTTIPDWKNCFKHGRNDTDFLHWSWKPEECELPSFDAKTFFKLVRGKTLAFVGDSLARNHMDSLLCLLSKEEVAIDIYKDSEDNNRIWLFPEHNFTLKNYWTRYLVDAQERIANGSKTNIFDLHLDKLDENWTNGLPTSDIIMMSTGHWFFRQMYLHINGSNIGCVYCNEPNVTNHGLDFALRMAVRSALNGINQCKNCKEGLITLLRTFSPAHFENGLWNTGGTCNRTSPFGEEEIDLRSFEWQLRTIQVEEFERVMEEKMDGKKFGLLDVTRAMLMRPDGHLGKHYFNRWLMGYNDCLHWCLPGPIDVWNDLVLALLIRVW